MADRGLRALRDDELVRGCARPEDRVPDRILQPLGRERLGSCRQAAFAVVGRPQQLDGSVHAGLGSPLSASNAFQLSLVLYSPPGCELCVIGREPEAGGTQAIGKLERELGGYGDTLEAEPAAGANLDLEFGFVTIQASGDELVPAELLERVHGQPGVDVADASGLHRGDDDMAVTIELGEEKRVGDDEGNLVPHLGRAQGVAVDQDIGHVPDLAMTNVMPDFGRAPLTSPPVPT